MAWIVQRPFEYTPFRIWLDHPDGAPMAARDRPPLGGPMVGDYRVVDPSPDGLLFTGQREGAEHIFGFALLAPDGTIQELCAQEYPYVVSPTWSPDGSAIAFSAAEDTEGTASALYVLERASGVIRRLGGVGYHDIFSWSPDGKRLCVVDDTEAGGYAVYLVARDGSARRHLRDLNLGDPSGEMDPARPAWSPDGQLLAVSTIPEGQEYSVVEFYTVAGLLVRSVAWPDAALVRIDDLSWQPRM